VAEARRIVEAAAAIGMPMRVVGGVGIALVAPTIRRLQPPRTYHDIDLAARPGSAATGRLMAALGYGAASEFNAINGSERLLFHDPAGRRVDVFVDTIRMCHVLHFRDRLEAWPLTLTAADLLLSKLQIVELTDRDTQDVLALLADHELTEAEDHGIDLRRIRALCGTDWGWWRTVDDNLERLVERWAHATADGDRTVARLGTAASERPLASDGSLADAAMVALDRARALRAALAHAPKSIGWRVRAVVGPRVRWYELPEEVR
jgi:hypothetical protein